MCKMISPGVFFNFKILILWVVRWLKDQKMAQNDKNLSVAPCFLGSIYHNMIFIYGTHVYIKG